MLQQFILLSLMLVVSACQAFSTEDIPATLQDEVILFATESAAIEQIAVLEQTTIVETIQAAETQVADTANSNFVLLATVRAGDIPTPAVVPIVVDSSAFTEVPSEMMDEGTGDMDFVQVDTASEIRESDGCVTVQQRSFLSTSPRIYLTARALNLRAGTNLSTEWIYEGQSVSVTSWIATTNETSLCIWFFIDPSDAPFSPGNWSVSLFADDRLIATVAFTIAGA